VPIITQNLPIPAGLANGSVADASQVVTLYNTFNAMNIPGTIGVFQQGFVDDSLYTVATGASKDWSVSVVATKSIIAMVPFSWSGATAAPTLIWRVNATNVTAASTFANVGTGNGLALLFVGGHDTDVARPLIAAAMDTNTLGTLVTQTANVDLPTATTSSVGLLVGGAGNTFKFKHVRFWIEG
jgi:hypothetical protein